MVFWTQGGLKRAPTAERMAPNYSKNSLNGSYSKGDLISDPVNINDEPTKDIAKPGCCMIAYGNACCEKLNRPTEASTWSSGGDKNKDADPTEIGRICVRAFQLQLTFMISLVGSWYIAVLAYFIFINCGDIGSILEPYHGEGGSRLAVSEGPSGEVNADEHCDDRADSSITTSMSETRGEWGGRNQSSGSSQTPFEASAERNHGEGGSQIRVSERRSGEEGADELGERNLDDGANSSITTPPSERNSQTPFEASNGPNHGEGGSQLAVPDGCSGEEGDGELGEGNLDDVDNSSITTPPSETRRELGNQSSGSGIGSGGDSGSDSGRSQTPLEASIGPNQGEGGSQLAVPDGCSGEEGADEADMDETDNTDSESESSPDAETSKISALAITPDDHLMSEGACSNLEQDSAALDAERRLLIPDLDSGAAREVPTKKLKAEMVLARALERERSYLDARLLCQICWTRKIEVTFLPCGHFVTCSMCSEPCNTCPVCEERVLAEAKTFLG